MNSNQPTNADVNDRAAHLAPALAKLAGTRDLIKTHEFAGAVGCATQTILKNHCLNGHAYGIKPVKIGNRLMWPVREIAALLNGGVQQ